MKWVAMLGSFLVAFLSVSPYVALSPNLETAAASTVQQKNQANQTTAADSSAKPTQQQQQDTQQQQPAQSQQSTQAQQTPAQQQNNSQTSIPLTYDKWIVTGADTNIHFAPDVNAPVILDAKASASFPVIDQKNDWDEVQIGSSQVGWVADWVVSTKSAPKQSQIVTVAANTKLLKGPGTDFATATTTTADTTYLPQEVSGDWLEIKSVDDGMTAWVPVQSSVWGSGNVQAAGPLQGKTIVLDPGHGGTDTGAIGKIKPVDERDVNLAVAEVLETKLQAAGAKVIMTRTSNDQTVSLADRVKISNDNKADVFISIHQNMFPSDPTVSGTITYYYDADSSKTLADDIEQSAVEALHSNQGKDQIDQDELYVLHHNERPSVLVEGCFLSNPKELDDSLQPDFQEHLATGIYNGVLKYFGK